MVSRAPYLSIAEIEGCTNFICRQSRYDWRPEDSKTRLGELLRKGCGFDYC
jgi:hypothetical protein